MLAFVGSYAGEEWCMLIHGASRGQAKTRFAQVDPSTDYDRSRFVDIRLTRLPGADDLPFTSENVSAAGFAYTVEGSGNDDPEFFNYCNCEICKGEKDV